MGAFIDLVGEKFGRLTVIERSENKGTLTCWLCECECGSMRVVQGGNLKNGTSSSCGCIKREALVARNTKHSLSKNPWYKIAKGVKKRICNPKEKCFERYGGRGLELHEPWHDVGVFTAWLVDTFGEYPSKQSGITLDRINNDRGYFPDNLRLVSKTEQNLNQRKQKNNTSGYRGVHKCSRITKSGQKYEASVRNQKQAHHIGTFNTALKAAQARNAYIVRENLPNKFSFIVDIEIEIGHNDR